MSLVASAFVGPSPPIAAPRHAGQESRTLRLLVPARRQDLIVNERLDHGHVHFFVKDPITLRYFKFAPAEFQVFQLLNGERTLDEIQQEFSREYNLQCVSPQEILALIQRWQLAGLLQEEGSSATARILAAQRGGASKLVGGLSRVLYFRVHAFDPDPLLTQIYPWVRWLFQPFGIVLAVCAFLSAGLLITARFEQFTSQPELQDFHAFFNLQNIFWLWLAVGFVKVLHEFGHGLTCKHFGGECHAMGLLFMCFTPCMYCDVSDSWMLPNKWNRIAIAAAGIYVELLIASLATFVWWWTAPGILHSIAFSAMLFGSVQTILINANPLMRFDGYYVLSDYLEVPNLRQKSYAFAKHILKKWFWGTQAPAPVAGGPAFVVYAVTASCYRLLLTTGMLWFFYRVLEPYKLAAVGYVLTALAVTNILVIPLSQSLAFAVRNSSSLQPASWWRPLCGIAVMAALVAAFLQMPIPRLAYAVLTLEPVESELVSASTRGTIVRQLAAAGQLVRQGDTLLELENSGLRMQAEQMEQQRDLLRVQSRVAAAILAPARTQAIQIALKELELQLAALHQRIDDLVLKAPCDGRVIPEPERESFAPQSTSTITPLGGWTRSPLHPANIGASLSEGTAIGRIATSDDYLAVAILSQTQIESVQPGQSAAIKLDAFPGVTILGTVEEVSVQDVDQVAPQLLNTNGSELPSISFGPNSGQLAETHYRVRIRLTELSAGELARITPSLRPGLRGRTWIRTGSQTAAQMTWRWVCQVLQW